MPTLRIQTLGTFRIWRQGELAPEDAWPAHKSKCKALLEILITQREHFVPAERLTEYLWPESTPDKAQNSLWVAVSQLRRMLQPDLPRRAPSDYILTAHEGYAFNTDSDHWLDVDAFSQRLQAARSAEETTAQIDAFEAARKLYRGDYLEEEPYEDWATSTREQLRENYLNLLTDLAEAYALQGRYRRAVALCRESIALDNVRESIYRQLMRYHDLAGERNAALKVYEECQRALMEELGVEPERETRDLYQQIQEWTLAEHFEEGQILEGEFPPLMTLDTVPTNLTVQTTPFVGRQQQLTAVTELIMRDDVRLVTLTGPGGIGKTRLSLQAAADVLHEFADGVFIVELAPLSDPGLVMQTVAGTLGVKQAGDEPLLNVLGRFLASKQLLLMLDNFEHLIDVAPLVAELLAAGPHVKILTTSRELLQVYGEHDYLVPPLSLPEVASGQTVATISQYEAVSLFIQRAKAARADFKITDENAPAIAEICARLEGLPLAIELAAARVRLFDPEALLERLSDRLKMLTGGARDMPHRQRTLRNAIGWSYDLLDADEQVLFARFGVFAGGCVIEEAEQICSEGLEIEVLDGLESLLNKSLLWRKRGPGGEPRFMILEITREFALERLHQSGESDEIQRRHATVYTEQAETSVRSYRIDFASYLAAVESEIDNSRAALKWALADNDIDLALRMYNSLVEFWHRQGYNSEALAWFERALEVGQPGLPEHRAEALRHSGTLVAMQENTGQSIIWIEEALAISRKLDDNELIARTLHSLAETQMRIRDFEKARANLEEALPLVRETGDKGDQSIVLNSLGELMRMKGDYDAAEDYYSAALRLAREIQWTLRISYGIFNLATVAQHKGQYDKAMAGYRQIRQMVADFGIADVGAGLTLVASVAIGRKQMERATCLLGAADARGAEIGWNLHAADQQLYDENLAMVQERLDEATFKSAWARGAAMSLAEARDYALSDGDADRIT